jgi:hypothetical protein
MIHIHSVLVIIAFVGMLCTSLWALRPDEILVERQQVVIDKVTTLQYRHEGP